MKLVRNRDWHAPPDFKPTARDWLIALAFGLFCLAIGYPLLCLLMGIDL